MRVKSYTFIAIIVIPFLLGALCGYGSALMKSRSANEGDRQNNATVQTSWSDGFSLVRIRSSLDGTLQPAYFLAARSGRHKPLVVSLHTWSGDYAEFDPLSERVKNEGWNYIHPNFRGPNSSKDSCLSEKVLSDIDDAIQYSIDNGHVDTNNIFVVGVSGGGHATLGLYCRMSRKIKAFLAWAPISDLAEWYGQAGIRNLKYAQDILHITSSGTKLNKKEAMKRSPLFWDLPVKPEGRLEIYAGINDGYTGSVPISHSILFFNRVVDRYGYGGYRVGQTDLVRLLARGVERSDNPIMVGDREVFYRRVARLVSLVIFDGAHEILPDHCLHRMKQIVGESPFNR